MARRPPVIIDLESLNLLLQQGSLVALILQTRLENLHQISYFQCPFNVKPQGLLDYLLLTILVR